MITSTEITHLMQQTAADAVQYAAEQYQIELDFSPESLQFVDDILNRLNQQQRVQPFSPEHLFTLSNLFGAYLGQVFISIVGGDWVHQNSDEDAPYVSLNYNNREFPLASLCFHKIVKDADISVREYVTKAMSNVMQ